MDDEFWHISFRKITTSTSDANHWGLWPWNFRWIVQHYTRARSTVRREYKQKKRETAGKLFATYAHCCQTSKYGTIDVNIVPTDYKFRGEMRENTVSEHYDGYIPPEMNAIMMTRVRKWLPARERFSRDRYQVATELGSVSNSPTRLLTTYWITFSPNTTNYHEISSPNFVFVRLQRWCSDDNMLKDLFQY